MAVPLRQVLREIEKNIPAKKVYTESEGFLEELSQEVKTKRVETIQEASKKISKISEQDPVVHYEAPASDEAKTFYRLNEAKRDLLLKAQRLKKEDEHLEMMSMYKEQGLTSRDYIKDILSKEYGVGKAFTNIEARTDVITNKLYSMMNDVRVELRTTWGGLKQNKELGYEMIRYLKDGTVKNQELFEQAKKLGEQWKETANSIKNLRNKAGGKVGTLEDWVMPQQHDKLKMKKAGKEAWKEFIGPKLDKARIEKEQGADLDKILDNAFDSITKRVVDIKPKAATSVIAKKNEFERVLHFKDGDSIVDYNKMFGNDDVLSIFDTHVRSQANEIAQMHVLGPNPELTYERLKMVAKSDGMGDMKEASLDRLFNTATGKADAENIIDKLDETLTSISQAHRAIQVGSKLGGATLSSIADVSNIIISSGYRNLNSFKIFGSGIKTLIEEATNKGVASRTQMAARIGVVSEFANASIANTRFAEAGAGWAQRRAENILRFSGLTAWTNALRSGFGLELSASIAEHFGKKFDDLPFKKMMEEYGFTAEDWAKIQTFETEEFRGAKFININKMDEEIGYRVGEMINSEMDSMIVNPGYRTRAITTWGAAKGTVAGEVARNITLFKSFPITIMMVHLNRFGHMTSRGRLAYGAGVLTTGVIFGTISLWLKDIAAGETPRDPMRKQMIPEAITQSGGLGIFGDLLLNEGNTRYGHSWSTTALGVPATTLEDIGKTTMDIITLNEDTVTNAYNRAKNYIPGQNLWYTRLVIKETIGDFFNSVIDPNYEKKKRRRKKALRLRGQEFILD